MSQSKRAERNGIGLDTQKHLDRLARDFPPLHEEAGRARTPGLFELPKLKVVGRPPKEEEEDNVANSHIVPANQLSSDSQERIVRRLKRDHEAEYAALQRGEYPSPSVTSLANKCVRA